MNNLDSKTSALMEKCVSSGLTVSTHVLIFDHNLVQKSVTVSFKTSDGKDAMVPLCCDCDPESISKALDALSDYIKNEQH